MQRITRVFVFILLILSSSPLSPSSPSYPSPHQGLSALSTLRQAVSVYVSKMAEMADPVKLAALFDKFSTLKNEDPAVRHLHRRMQEGDEEASYELQQMVADEAWGGRTYE